MRDDRFATQFEALLGRVGQDAKRPTIRGNAWMPFTDRMNVYLRIGPRMLDSYRMCVTIANITMDEADTRKGLFSALVRQIREKSGLPIMLENCRSDFADHLLRKGWIQVSTDGYSKNIVRYH